MSSEKLYARWMFMGEWNDAVPPAPAPENGPAVRDALRLGESVR
jgi:hypothetical protein